MRLHLVRDPTADETLGILLLLGLPFLLLGMAAVYTGWTRSIWQVTVIGLGWAGFLYSLAPSGLWRHHPAWSPVYQGVLAAVIIGGCAQLDRWWQRECPPVQARRTS